MSVYVLCACNCLYCLCLELCKFQCACTIYMIWLSCKNQFVLYVYTSKTEKIDCVCVWMGGRTRVVHGVFMSILYTWMRNEWKWCVNLDATLLLWTKQRRSYGNNFTWILFWCIIRERHLLLRLCRHRRRRRRGRRWITRMVYGRWWWWRLYRLIGKC